MDYAKFRVDYEQSGLTQKQYGQRVGMSGSMVCYYLKKGKGQVMAESAFLPLQITSVSKGKIITITTSSGIKIEIPS